jgi:hypothetical protein
MRNVVRLGVIVALALGASGARADEDPYPASARLSLTDQARDTDPLARDSDPGQPAPMAGAGSMEPQQATEEDPGTASHQRWVESIWTSP